MSRIERDYLLSRAEAERIAAGTASDPKAASVHNELADHYLKRAAGDSDPVVATNTGLRE